MATVINKDGQDQFGQEVHVLKPNDLVKTSITAKTRPGSPSANPQYVPVP
jgi:hypothetical protein